MLDREMAQKAIDMLQPAILACMEQGDPKPRELQIVVAFRRTGMEHDVLCLHSIGAPSDWETPIKRIAMSKALISLRTLLPTSEVQSLRPDLLWPNDTKHWGSAVRGLVVVAVAGDKAYKDEMYSSWIADACMALIKEKRALIGKSEFDFI